MSWQLPQTVSFCKGEGMKCYPRSSFSDSSRWHFPNKRTKWAQGAYSVILQRSFTFLWKKKCVSESSPFAVWNCSLNACIEFLVMLSPPPRAVGAAGTAWIWITKRRARLCSLWLYGHAPDAIVFVSSFLPLSLYCSFPLSLLIFEYFLTLSKAPSLIVDTKSSPLFG